jgi:hypothetical protein
MHTADDIENRTEAGRMGTRRIARVLFVVPALISLALAGCAGRETGAQRPDAPAVSVEAQVSASYMGTETIGIDRASLEGQADRVSDLRQASARVGAQVDAPLAANGSALKGQWVTKAGEKPAWTLFEYANGVIIEVQETPSAGDARRIVEDLVDDASFGPHIKTVDIGGVAGRAHEKLDIPPVWDASGTARPGTGVHTGIALVSWPRGRFVVKVMHPALTVSDLLKIAQGVKVTPLD